MSSNSFINPRIALVGNPNCGKTALFNALTGARQKVANYSGVTVEKKEGVFVGPQGTKVRVLDLPGTYSLRARSPDEAVTRDIVLGKFVDESVPDAIVCVADATNLHLGLRLVLELKKVGKPIILALNMMDVAKKRGYDIDLNILSKEIGVPVIPTIAIKKNGINDLVVAVEKEIEKYSAENTPNNNSNMQWKEPVAQEVRAYHREVERILCAAHRKQGLASEWTKKLDSILLHPVLGILTLFAILFVVFQAVFILPEYPKELIESGMASLQAWIGHVMPDGALKSLINDGVIAGVGGVLVFVPQIITLFFFILLLEDSGYMARAAFLMDKLMGGVGLHGKAFIPLLSSFACAIPGIMSARTIENKNDRLITILIAPLMTCSARLPVYTLIIAAFIPSVTLFGFANSQGLVMFGLYVSGILAGLIVAFILKTFFLKGELHPLLMELPTYKLPRIKNVALGLFERSVIFIRRAGTIILALMIIIWFLSTYPAPPANATDPAIDYSFAGMIGKFFEPILTPIGFNWQIAIALIPGMAAREVAVAALGTVYSISGNEEAVHQGLASAISHSWGLPTALAFLTWYIFAPQCASTLAVAKRETNSWIWPTIMFTYLIGLAYFAAFVVFNVTKYFVG
ncbi:ferrous iron transport protein B [Silvanigrella paludirubra]|uniref:Ferrous iron transport protein B n=1 Tax=Silvanigrella paludirubra TaxID=2499159 RepID=A0A6N6VYS5_9BACT|nr:ferrous iron transport protein B [Silvanigrella paludirubra]KAB8039538.1 ferrous iron transport protein B [Silvanigrella paludirubra]